MQSHYHHLFLSGKSEFKLKPFKISVKFHIHRHLYTEHTQKWFKKSIIYIILCGETVSDSAIHNAKIDKISVNCVSTNCVIQHFIFWNQVATFVGRSVIFRKIMFLISFIKYPTIVKTNLNNFLRYNKVSIWCLAWKSFHSLVWIDKACLHWVFCVFVLKCALPFSGQVFNGQAKIVA